MSGKQAFLSYCPKCGHQGIYENGNEKCPFCGTEELPTKYNWDEWLFGNAYPEHLDEIIFNEYIKDNPLFDEDLFLSRTNKDKLMEKANTDEQRESNIPKCPICQSTNLSKITNARKAGKIALFGIFGAGDLGKTWKCNNCGSKF